MSIIMKLVPILEALSAILILFLVGAKLVQHLKARGSLGSNSEVKTPRTKGRR